MKAAIIYFSQTGNTRVVAEKISEGLRQTMKHCDLLQMAEVDADALKQYDLLGLGCPAFYCKEPFNVTDFIEKLPMQEHKRWFVFCSHGAVMGQTLVSMSERLERRGAVVIGAHHTYADITVPFYPRPTLTSGHPDDQDLKEAFEFGKAIGTGGVSMPKPLPAPEDWARREAAKLTPEFLAQVMPRLSIQVETCTQCGECQNACPVGGIDIQEDPPRIQQPCIYCFHCVCICPTCSIEADWSGLVQMAPGNYARYKKALDAAKDRGEFRWRIDPEKIDCSRPLHRQREAAIKKK